ncbi:MAG: hypothetical protein Q9201_003962 [Fulgogasparrea decipioides]
MPEFVEFLFSFGYQSHAQDPFFSTFRQRTCLATPRQALIIPELAWSGSEIQICYNLKSAERPRPDSSSWSIRDCAVHHTFDVKNVRANWIMVKGNDLIRDRVKQATDGQSPEGSLSFATVDRAFAASLAVHLLICDWAAEQWRWYVNSLEDQFQNMSRRTLAAPVTVPPTPVTAKSEFRMQPRTGTWKTSGSIAARMSRIPMMLREKFSMANGKPSSPVQRTYTDPDSGLSQPLPPHIIMNSAPAPVAESAPTQPLPKFEDSEEQDFSFAKLQKIQHIQDKTHEGVLILRLNVSIISQLKQHYSRITHLRVFPQDVTRLCQDDLEHFELRLTGVLDDLQMQILRLESLSRLIGDHKTLV